MSRSIRCSDQAYQRVTAVAGEKGLSLTEALDHILTQQLPVTPLDHHPTQEQFATQCTDPQDPTQSLIETLEEVALYGLERPDNVVHDSHNRLKTVLKIVVSKYPELHGPFTQALAK